MRLVIKWNRVAGLVARGDLGQLRQRHIDDSLELKPHINGSETHLDVGSGGGFPGIPLAITTPNTQFVLLERSSKKSNFLRHVVLSLGLDNVDVLVQDIRHFDTDQRFDTLTARAVASPADIWSWCKPLLTPNAQYLAQSGAPISVKMKDGEVIFEERTGRGWVSGIRLAPI